MRDRYQRKPDPDPTTADTSKTRRCLMCGIDFLSAWVGERICARCRSRSVWREGVNWRSGGRSG